MQIGMIILLLGGLFAIISFGLLEENFDSLWIDLFVDALGVVLNILAAGFLFVGFLIFILGYGLWELNQVAWFVSTILYGTSSLGILLSFSNILTDMQTGDLTVAIPPAITIGLFIYLLRIRDKFN
jgi:hypothetical protein